MADRDTLTIRLALEGGADVRRELDQTAQSGEKASERVGSSAKEAGRETEAFGIEVKGLVTLFDEFERGQRGSFFATLGSLFKEGISGAAGLAAGITALAGAFLAVTVKGAAMASEIKEASTRVGTSAQNFSALKFVFEQSGAGAENFERAVGVIREAASSLDASADDTAAAQKKLDDALKSSAKAILDAEQTAEDAVETLKKRQGDRLADLQERQQKETLAAADQAGADLVALRQKHDQEIEDEADRAATELERLQRDNNEAIARENKKQFEAQEAALVAFNKELEDLADKSAQVQLGNFSSTDTAANIKALGVALQDANGKARDAHDVFLDIADRIGAIDDEATRSQVAVALFGRRVGPALVESLGQGRKGIEDLEAEAKRLGLLFSSDELDIGKKFSGTLGKLGDTLAATSAKIGLAFAPLFGTVGEALAKAFGDAQPTLVAAAKKIADALKPIFDDLAAAIEGRTGDIKSQFIAVLVPAAQTFGLAVSQLVTAIGKAFEIVGQAFETLAKFINAAGASLTKWDIPAFLIALRLVIAVVGRMRLAFLGLLVLPTIFNQLAAGLDALAGKLNDVFGTKISGTDIPAFAAAIYVAVRAVTALRDAFIALAAAPIVSFLIRVGGMLANFIGFIATVSGGASALGSTFAGLAAPIATIASAIAAVGVALTLAFAPLDTINRTIDAVFGEGAAKNIEAFAIVVGDTIVGAFQAVGKALDDLKQWFSDAWQSIAQATQPFIDAINTVIYWVQYAIGLAQQLGSALGAASSASSDTAAGPGGFASGGLVRGPGTGTSDSIPAWLSDGEHVTNAASTRRALPLLRAINSGPEVAGQLMQAFRSMRGFSLGGYVGALADDLHDLAFPRHFASGGLAMAAPAGNTGRPVVLNIGGSSYSLRGDQNVVEALERKATHEKMTSGGVKPSWHRG